MRKFKTLSKRAKIIRISLAVLIGLILVRGIYTYIAAVSLLSRHYKPDYTISTSPDDRYELVVREWSCLGGAGADVYIKEANSRNKTEIGTAMGDDYYQPFSNRTYCVEWESDKVTIYYYRDVPAENVHDLSTWRGIITYELE